MKTKFKKKSKRTNQRNVCFFFLLKKIYKLKKMCIKQSEPSKSFNHPKQKQVHLFTNDMDNFTEQ